MTPTLIGNAPYAFYAVGAVALGIAGWVARRSRGSWRRRTAWFVGSAMLGLGLCLGVTSLAVRAPASSERAMALALASPLTRASAATKIATYLRLGKKDDHTLATLVALDLAANDCASASRDVHDGHGALLVGTVRRSCGAWANLARSLWENGDAAPAAEAYEAARQEHPEPLSSEEIVAYATAGKYALAARTARDASSKLEAIAVQLEVLGGLRAPPPIAPLDIVVDMFDGPRAWGDAPRTDPVLAEARFLESIGLAEEALARLDLVLAGPLKGEALPIPLTPDGVMKAVRERSALGLARRLAIAEGDGARAARYERVLNATERALNESEHVRNNTFLAPGLGDHDASIALLLVHSEANARAAGFDDRTSAGRAAIAGDGETLARALRLQPGIARTMATVGGTLPSGRDALAVLLRTEAPLACAEADRDMGCTPRRLLVSLAERKRAARSVGDTATSDAAASAASRLRATRQGAFLTERELDALDSIARSVDQVIVTEAKRMGAR